MELSATRRTDETVDGSIIAGLLLLFGSTGWMGRELLLARRAKKGLHDKEIKELTMLVRLRDASVVMAMYGFAVFFFMNAGMSKLPAGTTEYQIRSNLSEFAIGTSFSTSSFAIVLHIAESVGLRKLQKTVRRHAHARKARSKPRFKFRSKA